MKITLNKNQTVWFTSDLHLDHSNIIKYSNRKFLSAKDQEEFDFLKGKWDRSKYRISKESTDMMNDHIIDNINKFVKKDDILFHLGDFTFAPKFSYRDTARYFMDRINCENVYNIWGNHDHREIEPLFKDCFSLVEVYIDNQLYVLCHYCMLTWNKSHHASIQLYGHSHSNLEEFAETVMPGRKSIDVGIDNAYKVLGEYRPFSHYEINEMMSKKKGHSTGDHHS